MRAMTDDAHMLVYSAVLTWIMILTASMIRTEGNLVTAFGNRGDLPPESALAGRADRAAKNMIENMVLFTAIWAATKGTGATGWQVTRGAQLFFIARVVYWPLYLAGVKVARTGAWAVGVTGMALLVAAALAA